MNHDDFEIEAEHDRFDFEQVEGESIEERADALLCLAQRRAQNPANESQVESLNYAVAAANLYRELGRDGDLFSALWAASDAQYALNLYADAIETCNEGVLVALKNFRESSAGAMEFNLGGIYANLGDSDSANLHYQNSVRYYEACQDKQNIARAYRWNAYHQQKAGNHQLALHQVLLGQELANQEGEAWLIVEFSILEATSLIALGEFVKAQTATDRVTAGLILQPNMKVEIKNEFNRARLLAFDGRHEQAIEAFTKVIEVLKTMKFARTAAKFMLEQSKSKTALGRIEEAMQDLKVVALTYENYPGSTLALDAFVELARVQLLVGHTAALESTLVRAKAMAEARASAGQPQLLELGQIEQQLNLIKTDVPLFDEIETGPIYLASPGSIANQK